MMTKRVARPPSLRDLAVNREGSASIEHAVLFGVVILSLVVGVYSLGQMSKAAFSSATSAIVATPAGKPSPSATSDNRLPDVAAADSQTAGWHVFAVGVALFVACGAPLSYIILRPHIKSAKEKQQEQETAEKVEPTHDDNAFEKRQQIRRVFENNMASLLQGQLKVRHVMSRQLTCVRKTATVESVLELMELKKVRHIMVSEADGTLLGTVTDKDCAKRSGKRASDVMTTDPITLDADSDFAPAVTMLIRRRVSCLPVTSNGKLAGILTTTDFLMALQCALHTLGNVVEHLSSRPIDADNAATPRDTTPPPTQIPAANVAMSPTLTS